MTEREHLEKVKQLSTMNELPIHDEAALLEFRLNKRTRWKSRKNTSTSISLSRSMQTRRSGWISAKTLTMTTLTCMQNGASVRWIRWQCM